VENQLVLDWVEREMTEKQEYQNQRIGNHLRFLDNLSFEIRKRTREMNEEHSSSTGEKRNDA